MAVTSFDLTSLYKLDISNISDVTTFISDSNIQIDVDHFRIDVLAIIAENESYDSKFTRYPYVPGIDYVYGNSSHLTMDDSSEEDAEINLGECETIYFKVRSLGPGPGYGPAEGTIADYCEKINTFNLSEYLKTVGAVIKGRNHIETNLNPQRFAEEIAKIESEASSQSAYVDVASASTLYGYITSSSYAGKLYRYIGSSQVYNGIYFEQGGLYSYDL